MKWSDLTLKERKKLYDTVRAENPNASYLDIKNQFDLISTYENGKDKQKQNYGLDWNKFEEQYNQLSRYGINSKPRGLDKKGLAITDSILKTQDYTQDQRYALLARVVEESGGNPFAVSKNGKWRGLLQYTEDRMPDSIYFPEENASYETAIKSQLDHVKNEFPNQLLGWNDEQATYKSASNARKAWNDSNTSLHDLTTAVVQNFIRPGDRIGTTENTLRVAKLIESMYQEEKQKRYTPGPIEKEINSLLSPRAEYNPNNYILTLEDVVPAYEDGKGKKNASIPKELGYTPGTPEYYKRQQQISGRVGLVQPEAYVTPAGYIKDAITTAEELEQGNYGNAAVSTLMNFIPWGVGKGLKKIKSRVSNVVNTPIEVHSSIADKQSLISNAVNNRTAKNKKGHKKSESDYDSEFSEVLRRSRNINKYEKEISKTIEDAVLPDENTYELVKRIDNSYDTNYADAYKRIAARDMTNRGKYIKYTELPDNKNAKISRVRELQEYGPVVDDYVISIDPLQYLPGTANHELGHLADQLAADANNRYLNYLLDEGNIMGPGELRNKGIQINPSMQAYLLDPSESKSHMLHLKRALINEGKINDWSSKINQNTIEDFLFDPRNTSVVNNANKLQYNMYRNKSRFVDRMNNLTPMEFIAPALLPFTGYELNKE